MKYMLKLKLVNMFPLNLKFAEVWDKEMQLWEIAIRRAEVKSQGSIFEKCSQIMAYANDVFIKGRLQDV